MQLSNVFNLGKNFFLSLTGARRDLATLIKDNDISKALDLFENNDFAVADAIKEYNPLTHDVMKRPDKIRKNRTTHIVQKLPRSWQRYINEVALFFLLAKPIKFKLKDEENSKHQEAFTAFQDFLKDLRFNPSMRSFKRIAGAETECAKLYRCYKDKDNNAQCQIVILSRQNGYYLRPLFDQYKNMIAFGYGYYLNEGSTTVEHFDIETPEVIYECKKELLGWSHTERPNPTGKINVIYAKQPKEWEGSEPRIKRDEMLDSKAADTNDYFADPMVKATKDAMGQLPDPEQVGKVIQLTGKDSVFEYIEPPTSIEMKDSEKKVLRGSILQDTFTPDFSAEAMTGTGDLSGEALKRAMILGYMKRDNSLEIYDPLVDREINLILAIMANVTHTTLAATLKEISISHTFAEPFDEDTTAMYSNVCKLYDSGLLSLEEAVQTIGLTKDNAAEVDRILKSQEKKSKESAWPTAGV